MATKQTGKKKGGKGAGKAKTAASEPSPPPSASRARPRDPEAQAPSEVAGRVLYVLGQMAANLWTRQAALEMAAKLNVSLSAIHNYAAEAARLGAGAFGEPEALRAKLLGHLDEAIELARLDPMPAAGARAITGAVEAMARLTGALAPTKIAQTDAAGADLPAEVLALLTRPQAAAFVALPIDPVPPKE